MDIVIKAEELSKAYQLGEFSTGTLSRDIERVWYRMRGKDDPFLKLGEENNRAQKGTSNMVWSLKDINFDIRQGDAVGIIGRNGAGKSTLLKILSRVTTPTAGSVKIKGRIASLLEVGTGFHPELTGRENIFLNGAILGMRKSEIKSKFDEIVDFSGVERYIDTPVKRYSSGMYVRLAFAVAAYLESEILVVDEVLAVGDAEFQKKCLGKMSEVSKGDGRTVLFVSHNMAAVKTICNSGIVLEQGKTIFNGDATQAVSHYLKGDSESHSTRTFNSRYETADFALRRIQLANSKESDVNVLLDNDEIILSVFIQLKNPKADRFHVTFHLNNESGEGLFSFATPDNIMRAGENTLMCKFPASFFQSGTFYLSFFVVADKKEAIFHEKDILSFDIVEGGRELGVFMGREPGSIRPKFEWINKF